MTGTYDIAGGLRGAEEREFRNALGRFATGITVITTRGPDGAHEGMTANAFSALSLSPPLVLWCARRNAPSRAAFEGGPYFTIHVLAADQRDLSVRFATPATDKFVGIEWGEGLGGVPLIGGTLAAFECRQHGRHDGGDHVIFIGQVERFSYREGAPLLFSAGRYAVAEPHPGDHATSAEAGAFADLLL